MVFLRGVAIAAAVGVVWTMGAARVAGASILPVGAVVRGAVLTQPFGCSALTVEPFDPYCPTRHFHSGVDLAAPPGTPVYAATSGIARVGEDPNGCGLFVLVTFNAHVRLLYCHLSRVVIAAGPVTAGDLVGQVGSTGLAFGAHLHFEVQVDGRSVDPVRWLASS